MAAAALMAKDRKMVPAEQLVLDLTNSSLRENALLDLSKVRCFVFFSFEESYDLACLLIKVWLSVSISDYCSSGT